MKAVVIGRHGGPEVLTYTDVGTAKPARREVLVKVKRCALNRSDINTREGWYGRDQRAGWQGAVRFPLILGSDIAGEVVELGADTEGVRLGERVVVNPWITCGACARCREGDDHLCLALKYIGSEVDGGYAEYIAVPAANVMSLPADVGYDDGAAFPVTFGTAWHMLVTRACVRAGEQVLITGGGSGVGVAAIQVAKLCGARVIAIASTEEKLAGALRVGADATINYTREHVPKKVRELTQDQGVDVIVDVLGAPTWNECLECLRVEGRLVICGAAGGYSVASDLRSIYLRHITVIGSTIAKKVELEKAWTCFLGGRLKPVIGKVFRLEEAASAHMALMDRSGFGRVLLRID